MRTGAASTPASSGTRLHRSRTGSPPRRGTPPSLPSESTSCQRITLVKSSSEDRPAYLLNSADFLQRLSRNFPPSDAVLQSWPQGALHRVLTRVFCSECSPGCCQFCQSKSSSHASWTQGGRQPTVCILLFSNLATAPCGGILVLFTHPCKLPLPPLVEATKFTST